MAELSVSARYETPLAKAASSMLRLGFPVWGLVAPIVGLILLIGLIVAAVTVPTSISSVSTWIGVPIAWLAVAMACLMAMRIFSHNTILIDKTGIVFPLLIRAGHARYTPWSSIRKVDILNESADQISKKTLVFYFNRGAPIKLSLNQMQPSEIEQMLIAVEMWGGDCELAPSITMLKDNLKSDTTEAGKMSYTTMWEDELRRRFSSTAFMPLAPGQILRNGSLKVVRQLSLGGLSAVYLCQLDENRLVVLKEAVVPEDGSVEMREKAKELFEREATFLKRLKHHSIVSVLDYFGDGGRNYLMLEYANGQDLRQYVRQNGAQKEENALDWAIQVAGILKYLHEQDPPIIHRDISPDNLVLREDGTIVVIDFGAANEFISKATGTFVGKQSFIAPEQFRGKAVVQSDIYAFGCTLYYLLTGKEPEALSTSNPKDVNSDVSDELAEFVVSCTQLEPRDRYQSAAQLLPVLRRLHSTVRA